MGKHSASEFPTQQLPVIQDSTKLLGTVGPVASHRRPTNPIIRPLVSAFVAAALTLPGAAIVDAIGTQGLKGVVVGTAYVAPANLPVVEPKTVPEVVPTPTTPPPIKPVVKPVVPQAPVPSKAEKVIAYAMAQLGDRYVWAAAGPNAFDCSGLVMMAFKQVGIALPHYTGTMISKGKSVSRAGMMRGDIIFPERSHVGIYLGNGKYIAAESNGVVIAKVTVFYAARRLI